MESLSDRIAVFLKLAESCIVVFELPETPPMEPHPLFNGITFPKGFEPRNPFDEAMGVIPESILEGGPFAWRCEGVEQAEGIAKELARYEWGKDAVRSLVRFISISKGRNWVDGYGVRGSLDWQLWEQVRADLEDAAELLRIDASKVDGGKAAGGKPAGNNNDRLREWLRSLPWDKPRPTIRQAAEYLGVKSISTVSGLPAWKEEMAERERRKLPGKARQEIQLANGADRLLVDGQQRIPTDPQQDAAHAEAYCEGGDVFSDPDTFRSLLLDFFTDESKTAREYRVKVNKLKPSDLAALLAYLKETLGGKLAYEQIELIRYSAESWLDEHR